MIDRNPMKLIRICVVVLAAAVSCSKESSGEGATAQAKSQEHASANVKPGSHEDWCDEHQVPESMCTKCNPSLIAAFKATGDWCDEHGLPESHCLMCNPNLKIVRPPAGK